MTNRQSEKGNAIIWILIAVGLFAALNYAFTSSSRTSTSLLNDSEAKAYASQIIAYGNEVKSAVKRLQLRGCDDTEISFENNVVAGYTNPNAPANKSCHVFDLAGGGLTWQNTPESIQEGSQYGNYRFTTKPVAGAQHVKNHGEDTQGDLYLYIRGRIDAGFSSQDSFLKVCQSINEMIGIPKYPSNTNEFPQGATISSKFIGVYDDGGSSFSFPEIEDKNTYCSNENTGYFNFSKILIAR